MGLRNLTVNAGNWNVEERTGYVDLSIENTYKGNEGHEFSVGMTFKVCADGVLLVNTAITPAISGVVLPKIGFRTEMPEGFDRVAWFGRGPWESYADRKEACFEGVYSVYNEPFKLPQGGLVSAYATAEGYYDSRITTADCRSVVEKVPGFTSYYTFKSSQGYMNMGEGGWRIVAIF